MLPPAVIIGVVICCTAAWCSYLYIGAPTGMHTTDQWLMRKLYALQRIGDVLGKIGYTIGYDTELNIKRAFNQKARHAMPPGVDKNHYTFDGVPVFLYKKKIGTTVQGEDTGTNGAKLRPAIYYIHGGGWVHRHTEAYEAMERHLVNELDIILVSVQYRVSPEFPYPVPLNDCLAALKYFHQNAKEFGVDPQKITIAGDSAGGNLAAAVTLKLRDEGLNQLLHSQILISPATHMTSFSSNSIADYGKYSFYVDPYYFLLYINESQHFREIMIGSGHLTERMMQHKSWPYFAKYHTSLAALDNLVRHDEAARVLEEKLMDPYICPMMAESLAGLPPALILMSEFDVLRDDAFAYADRLRAEGTEVVTAKSDGFHGVYGYFRESPSGKIMVNSIIDHMRTMYAR